MAYPNKRPLTDKYLTCQMADLAEAQSTYVVVAGQGNFIGWRMTPSATQTGSAAITVEINGTAVSSAAKTVAAPTIGTSYTQDCVAQAVKDGDIIEFISNGGSTTTAIGYFTAIIRED